MSVKVYSWQDAAKVLEKGINRNKVIPGNGISAEATPHGTVISALRDGTSTAAGYAGYFTVMDVSDEDGFKVRVVEGHRPDWPYAGLYQHGGMTVLVPQSDVISFPPGVSSGTVYVTISYTHPNYIFTYDLPGFIPQGSVHIPLAYVSGVVSGGVVKTIITQLHYGVLLTPGVL